VRVSWILARTIPGTSEYAKIKKYEKQQSQIGNNNVLKVISHQDGQVNENLGTSMSMFLKMFL
jgi:hypothetical protein